MPLLHAPTTGERTSHRIAAWLRAVALPLLVLGGVTALKLHASSVIGPPTPFLLYFGTIIVSSWFGGWVGGLLATLGSTLVGNYFFLTPHRSLFLQDPAEALRLLVFFAEGLAVTAIAARLRWQSERADAVARTTRNALAQLEGVLRGVTDGIIVQTEDGRLLYVNDTGARMSGFSSPAEMLAASLPEIMARYELRHPDGTPFDLADLPGRRVLRGETSPPRLVWVVQRQSGREHFAVIRANVVTIGAADGTTTRVAVNVFEDVTEKRRQDEELRLREEWLSTTLRSIGDAVIATDAQGRVRFMNPPAESLTGWRSGEAEGQPVEQVFRILRETTREVVPNPVERVLQEGQVVGLANHTVLVHRNGGETPIEDTAAPIRLPQGTVIGAVLVFRDVSERRAEERRRAFIGRATAELALSLDYKETLTTVVHLAVPQIGDWCAVDMRAGDRLERLAVHHVDPAKIGLVYEIERLYPPDPAADAGSYAVLRTGQPVFLPRIPEEALLAAAKDPTHLELIRRLQLRSFIAVPLTIDGQVIGVLTLAMAESGRSYTERDLDLAHALADRAVLAVKHSQLFSQATAARAEAEQASRTKDEFLAMLGHELRNPLAPIVTALELMAMRAPTTLERERGVIGRQVKHLVRLVDDLLDVSRITRGKIALAREVVDVRDVVARALEACGPLLEERRQVVETEYGPGAIVLADPTRLAQVVSNLVTNAAKYTDPGGHLWISARREGTRVALSVRDDGAGIDPELLPRVFDLFVQGSQAIDRAKGGLGLGLAIVRIVTELHGGTVEARSAGLGRGSEFRVLLPAHQGTEPSASVQTPPRGSARVTGRLLIVDDNQDALELLRDALVAGGWDVVVASDAVGALRAAETFTPDVALLDIGLPVIDGYELARRLRATAGWGHVRFVAVTGYGQPRDLARAHDAGFDDHLVKPVSLDKIVAALARLHPPVTS